MPNSPSELRAFFDRIDAAELLRMQSRHDEENYYLDFKRMSVSGEPSTDDEANLRRAISGFANSAGGIVLWGVESKTADKKDTGRFQSIVPMNNADSLLVRLQQLTAFATQPPVSGVLHESIRVDGGWVIKTFVPESDAGPHRTNEGDGQYYRRGADTFRAMQHHEIADMFGRRPKAILQLWNREIAPVDRGPLPKSGPVFLIGLRNLGRGLARFPCVQFRVKRTGSAMDFRYLDSREEFGLGIQRFSPGFQELVLAGGVADVIHPGQIRHVLVACLPDASRPASYVEYRIYAEGMLPAAGEFRLFQPNGMIDEPRPFEGEAW